MHLAGFLLPFRVAHSLPARRQPGRPWPRSPLPPWAPSAPQPRRAPRTAAVRGQWLWFRGCFFRCFFPSASLVHLGTKLPVLGLSATPSSPCAWLLLHSSSPRDPTSAEHRDHRKSQAERDQKDHRVQGTRCNKEQTLLAPRSSLEVLKPEPLIPGGLSPVLGDRTSPPPPALNLQRLQSPVTAPARSCLVLGLRGLGSVSLLLGSGVSPGLLPDAVLVGQGSLQQTLPLPQRASQHPHELGGRPGGGQGLPVHPSRATGAEPAEELQVGGGITSRPFW